MRAFVLSGGASLGAIQAGMLAALYERDIAPDLVVGTSVGALNGAFIASRSATPQTAEALGDVWRSLRRGDVFPLNPLTGFLGFFGRDSHLVPGGPLRRLIAANLEFERLEEAPVPLHVVAADVADGRELRLSRGPALDAVVASAAIPGVFPPVEWDGRLLVDGGCPTTRRSRTRSSSEPRRSTYCRPAIRARCRNRHGGRWGCFCTR